MSVMSRNAVYIGRSLDLKTEPTSATHIALKSQKGRSWTSPWLLPFPSHGRPSRSSVCECGCWRTGSLNRSCWRSYGLPPLVPPRSTGHGPPREIWSRLIVQKEKRCGRNRWWEGCWVQCWRGTLLIWDSLASKLVSGTCLLDQNRVGTLAEQKTFKGGQQNREGHRWHSTIQPGQA